MRLLSLMLLSMASLHALDLTYWVEPCTREETRCASYDPQFAEWALAHWEKASNGRLHFAKASRRLLANIRIHWASRRDGLYGEARYFVEDGMEGYDVYVLPDLTGMGPDVSAAATKDSLLRDAIVYLTCLHETGHALRLSHTDAFADIMYSFQYGGDIPEYFGRYRRRIRTREDIRNTPGYSSNDTDRLLRALPQN